MAQVISWESNNGIVESQIGVLHIPYLTTEFKLLHLTPYLLFPTSDFSNISTVLSVKTINYLLPKKVATKIQVPESTSNEAICISIKQMC